MLGGSFFFTAVTAARRPILTTELGRTCLREALIEVNSTKPFDLFAIVLLPDHLHAIWNLPVGDGDFSSRWADMKPVFTKRFLKAGGTESAVSASRRRKGERGVGQRRFWEHVIRDEDGLKHCLDYLHFNPCKHGYVARVRDWPWSSFQRFVAIGEYSQDWGSNDDIRAALEIFGDAEYA